MRKRRIAIIGAKGLPARDGISRVVEGYMPILADRYDFTVFCTGEYTERKNGFYDGYEEIVLPTIKNKRLNTLWYYIQAVWIILFRRNFDLIHFHHCDAAFLFPIVRLKYGKRLLVTTHGAFTQINDKWKKYRFYFWFQYRLFLRIAPYLTAVSKKEREKTHSVIGKESEFIPNGISLDERISTAEVDSGYILFAAGRIMALKGLDILLEALNYIGYKGKLKVAGDISLAPDEFKSKISQLARGLDVDFVGMITDKSLLFRYLKNAGLFVFPSRAETMSMQLLEAASMRVPVIASDIVENKDVFDGDEVLFFRTGDPKDLAAKIEYALENRGEMVRKAGKAYDTLSKNYTWNILSEKYAAVYDKILNEHLKKR